jgi:uncharacterized protein (TIGR00106 family)
MSVLMNFAMFPTDKGGSVSLYVSRIIKLLRRGNHRNQLTAMGTLVETETLQEALDLLNESYKTLEDDCERVYLNVTIDIRKGKLGRIDDKIRSIEEKIEGKD